MRPGGFGKPGGFGGAGRGGGLSLSALKAKKDKEEKKDEQHVDPARSQFGTGVVRAPPSASQPQQGGGEESAAPSGPVEELKVSAGGYQVLAARAALSEEEKKLRAVNGVLNKFAPEKYEVLCQRLFDEHDLVNDAQLVEKVLPLIFKRAVSQPDLCGLFADFCLRLVKRIGEQQPDGAERAKEFRKTLLSEVQKEYEHMVDRSDGAEVPKQRRLGTAQFVGELFVQGLLNNRIMQMLLNELRHGTADPADPKYLPSDGSIEVMAMLVGVCGKAMDVEACGGFVERYLESLKKLSVDARIPPRLRFILLNTAELRERGWPDTNARAKKISEQERMEREREEAKLAGAKVSSAIHKGEQTAWGSAAEVVAVKTTAEKQKPKPAQQQQQQQNKSKKKNNKKK